MFLIKVLFFKKLFFKAYRSKPKMVGDSKTIMCLLEVFSPTQNSISHVNNDMISIGKGI